MKKGLVIGTKTVKAEVRIKSNQQPKRKFRIVVQERVSQSCDKDTMTAFMVYDFTGRTTPDGIVKKLKDGINPKNTKGN